MALTKRKGRFGNARRMEQMNTNSIPSIEEKPLTLDAIREVLEGIKIPPNPFEQIALNHGFDLQKDDILIVPRSIFQTFPELEQFRKTKGLMISRWVNRFYLMKSQLPALPQLTNFPRQPLGL